MFLIISAESCSISHTAVAAISRSVEPRRAALGKKAQG
jgi:hypothetical protein